MSDPLSNREIEDVLSSIRRLVAQGDPLRPDAGPSGAAPEKLVLTPAFRVAAPPEEPAPVAVETEPEVTAQDETPAQGGDAPPSPSLEATIAELEAAISAYGGPFEPDGGDAASSAPDFRLPAASNGPEAADHDGDAEAPGEMNAPAQPQGPELSSDRAQPDEKPASQAAADRADPAPNVHSFHHVPVSGVAKPDPQRDAPAPELDAALLDDDGDEAPLPLDEALLRELVTDILREELQGALGQRITRNVRKLVRAEIARALASRDLA